MEISDLLKDFYVRNKQKPPKEEIKLKFMECVLRGYKVVVGEETLQYYSLFFVIIYKDGNEIVRGNIKHKYSEMFKLQPHYDKAIHYAYDLAMGI